jgi:drug/metabolite transporter (DMT)-like permease
VTTRTRLGSGPSLLAFRAMDRRRAAGVALILASAAGFGSGSLFAQPVYASGVDWLVLSAWRFLFGAGLTWLWLLASPGRRRGLRALDRRAIVIAIGLGILYTGNSGAYYAGLETVSPGLAGLIVFMYPVLVAVASLRIGQRLEGRRAWASLVIALVGVVLTIGGIDPTQAPPVSGILLIVASTLIYTVWILLAARLAGERRDTVGDASERGAAASAATALMMTTTAAIFWGWALLGGRPVLPAEIPAAAWGGMLGIGVVSTFVAIQAFYGGAQRIGAAQASIISTVEPIWTIVLAYLLFGFTLTPTQLVGGALIIVGVLVAQTGPGARRSAGLSMRVADE